QAVGRIEAAGHQLFDVGAVETRAVDTRELGPIHLETLRVRRGRGQTGENKKDGDEPAPASGGGLVGGRLHPEEHWNLLVYHGAEVSIKTIRKTIRQWVGGRLDRRMSPEQRRSPHAEPLSLGGRGERRQMITARRVGS